MTEEHEHDENCNHEDESTPSTTPPHEGECDENCDHDHGEPTPEMIEVLAKYAKMQAAKTLKEKAFQKKVSKGRAKNKVSKASRKKNRKKK
jgi:hypothetical protein